MLTISTPGWSWSPGVIVDLGPGITTVGPVELVAPDLLLVQAETSQDADEGDRNVIVRQQGTIVVGSGILEVVRPGGTSDPSGGHNAYLEMNLISDPGFEKRDMTDWNAGTWTVDTEESHGGEVSAHDGGATGGGGLCLRQDFNPPIDSNSITSFSFWLRQPDDQGIAQVAIFYQNGPTQYGAAFSDNGDDWTFEDFSSLLRPNDHVTAIHICGFGGGTPTYDDSWADDFQMTAAGGVPVATTSWGHIKGLYRENR